MKLALPLLACTLALAGGCGKKRADGDAPRYLEERELDDEGDAYEPDPTEVPLTVDFEKAVKRKIRADNYREELARIERELKLSTRER